MSIQCILAYPNLDYPNPRISEQPKAGLQYNIIHKHVNDIHIVIELSVIYFSMYFTYPNFSVIRTKIFFCLHKGVRISEDALYTYITICTALKVSQLLRSLANNSTQSTKI